MTDYTNTYPDLVNVEDWLNAKGYTGEAGACHQAMRLIRSQKTRIEELEAALRPFAEQIAEARWEEYNDNTWVRMPLGDLRAAHAALEKKND